jgi:hypothetical protein
MTSNERYELFSPAEAVNRLASSGFSRADAQRMVDQYLQNNTAQWGEPTGGWMVDRYDLAEIIDHERAQRAARESHRGTVGITDGITGAERRDDTSTDDTSTDDTVTVATADVEAVEVEASVVGLECPECGEDAVEQPPDDLVPYAAHGMAVPRYAHADGEPLCPVPGPRGYEPAQPREILHDSSSGDGADPLQAAKAAVTAAVTEPIVEPSDDRGRASVSDTDMVDGSADGSADEVGRS